MGKRMMQCVTALVCVSSTSVAVGAESDASERPSVANWQKSFVTCEKAIYEHDHFEDIAIRKRGGLSVAQAEAAFAVQREAVVRQLVFKLGAEEFSPETYQSTLEAVDAALYARYQQDRETAVQEYGRIAADCDQFYEMAKQVGSFAKVDSHVRAMLKKTPELWEKAKAEFVEAATKPRSQDNSPKQSN